MEGRRQGAAVADTPGATYRERRQARRDEAARLERRHGQLAWTRLGVFLAGALVLVIGGGGALPWLAAPLVAFVALLVVHARVLNARDRARRAAAFYERGLARIEDRWPGGGDRGEQYRDPAHLYADDLDLFGAGGLFELLVTARTGGGEDVLAGWLLRPADPATVRDRQHAVRELAPRLDLREDLAVLGPEVDAAVRTRELIAWATAPPQLTARWPPIVLPVVAAASTILVGWWLWTAEPPALLLPVLGIQVAIALGFRHRVHRVTHGAEPREQELAVLATLMARIEAEPAESPRLRAIRDRLRATGRAPADEVARLARLVALIGSGHNLIFAPLSALWLLGTQLAFAVERWRARCGAAVPGWLDAVAEYEALASLATYAAEHPDDVMPEMVEGEALLEGEALAHPLLPAAAAVANDVHLGRGHPHLLLVSGSNMSGKSTLLRTVGLNVVLAQAGAPVRARRLRLTPLRAGATLRVLDSLQSGRSRFFTEITRISAIVAMTREPSAAAVLFLLDELLSGTNSDDRQQGAAGILDGLVGRGAIGLATTHDLALTAIADRLGPRAANVHFDDRFADGVLTFDYRLQPGVVRSRNAVALMRAVGLEI